MDVVAEEPVSEIGRREGSAELLSERVYARLKREIVFGRLPPNAKIVEREICEQFAVSRTPLREALLRLAADGLVIVKPQSGTLVAPITLSRVMAAQFIRERLECGLVRRVTDCWNRAGHATLLENIAAQKVAAECNDFEGFHDLDEAFHGHMSIIAGLPDVWTTIAASKPHLDRIRIESLDRRKHIHDLILDHTDIVAALADRDVSKAKRRLRAHLRQVLRSLEYLNQ